MCSLSMILYSIQISGCSTPHLLVQLWLFSFPIKRSLSLFPLYISAALSLLYMIFTSFFSLHHTQVPSLLNGLLWLACRTFAYTVAAWVVSDDVMDTFLVTLVYNLSLFPLSYIYTIILTHLMIRVLRMKILYLSLSLSLTSLEASCFPLHTLIL